MFACSQILLGIISNFLWNYIAKKLESRIRFFLFQKILEQEISWFDNETPEVILSKYFQDINDFVVSLGHPHVMLWAVIGELITGMIIAVSISIVCT